MQDEKNVQQIHLDLNLTVVKYCPIAPNGLHSARGWRVSLLQKYILSSCTRFHKYSDHIVIFKFMLRVWFDFIFIMYWWLALMLFFLLLFLQWTWQSVIFMSASARFDLLRRKVVFLYSLSSFFGLINDLQICANLTSWSISSING